MEFLAGFVIIVVSARFIKPSDIYLIVQLDILIEILYVAYNIVCNLRRKNDYG